MKNNLLLLVLLFPVTVVFAQGDWGAWVQNPCFKGLYSRSKVRNYNDSAQQYTWDIEIKSNYGTKVSLDFDIQNSSIDGRITIEPGGVDKSWTLNPSNGTLLIEFSRVCFHHPDGYNKCSDYEQNGYASFAECDLGAPKYHVYNGVNSSNNANTSTTYEDTTSSQQNNLDQYNRSQQETEANLARENAEILRQNQESSNRLQAYNNGIRSGVSAHNSGNYEEAKRQFTIAINNSNTQQDRNNAQQYYNKTVSLEKDQSKIKAVGDLAVVAINAIDQYQKAKQEERRIEEEKQRLEEEEAARNSALLNEKWFRAQEIADNDTEDGYRTALQMMAPEKDRLNGMALNTLGYWYWKLEDHTNAMIYYRQAAAEGSANGMYNVGVLYDNGSGVNLDRAEAQKWFRKACDGGYADGCTVVENYRLWQIKQISTMEGAGADPLTIAVEYYQIKDYVNAAHYFNKADETSGIKGYVMLRTIADMYYDADKLNDKKTAVLWDNRVIQAMENDMEKKHLIGKKLGATGNKYELYDDQYTDVLFRYAGYIKSTDGNAAIEAYSKAVRQGYSGANTNIGLIYDKGEGSVQKDWNLAKMYYEKDVTLSAKAMYLLSLLYKEGGPNLPQDKGEARKWLKAACKKDKKYCE